MRQITTLVALGSGPGRIPSSRMCGSDNDTIGSTNREDIFHGVNRRNYYRILHVQPEAPSQVITASYRTLMSKLRLHPDFRGRYLPSINRCASSIRYAWSASMSASVSVPLNGGMPLGERAPYSTISVNAACVSGERYLRSGVMPPEMARLPWQIRQFAANRLAPLAMVSADACDAGGVGGARSGSGGSCEVPPSLNASIRVGAR